MGQGGDLTSNFSPGHATGRWYKELVQKLTQQSYVTKEALTGFKQHNIV